MKINKILAAGIAATLAVTSLAAVAVPAAAETKTFDMAKSLGTVEGKGSLGGAELALLAAANGAANAAFAAGIDASYVLDASDFESDVNGATHINSVTLKVTGIKGAKNNASQTYSYAFDNFTDAACTAQVYDGSGNYWKLTSYETNKAPKDKLDISQFVEITQVAIDITTKTTGLGETRYTKWENWKYTGGCTRTAFGSDNAFLKAIDDINIWGATLEVTNKSTSDTFAFLEKTTDNTTINRSDVKLLSMANANQASTLYTAGMQQEYEDSMTQSFNDGREGTAPFWFGGLASWVADFFNKQNNGKITFNFTDKASASSGWKNGGIPSTEVGLKSKVAGTTMGLFVNYNQSTGSLQTLGQAEGTSITFDISEILQDMGGLTKGNVSDIYYGMNQGLDYKNDDYKSVHAATAAGVSAAEIDNARVAMQGTDFNYAQREGIWYKSDATYAKYTAAEAAAAGAGVAEGDPKPGSWTNGHGIGYIVESVTLSYDEAAAAADADVDDEEDDTDVTDDADDEEEDDVAADDADDDEEDEDDDAELTDDTDDDDDVANDEDINTPADDDANPGTGVALAVIPAIVAAAAAVVSKKRK